MKIANRNKALTDINAFLKDASPSNLQSSIENILYFSTGDDQIKMQDLLKKIKERTRFNMLDYTQVFLNIKKALESERELFSFKNLNDFYDYINKNYPTLKNLKSLQIVFEQLDEDSIQKITDEYFNYKNLDYYPNKVNNKYQFIPDTLVYKIKGTLPKVKDQLISVRCQDSLDNETSINILIENNKLYVIDSNDKKWEAKLNKEDNILKYEMPGNEAFCAQLFKLYKNHFYTHKEAFRDKNLTVLLHKYYYWLWVENPYELMRLTYNDNNGRYGTLLHEAIEVLSNENFLKLYSQLKTPHELVLSYKHLRNNKGQTILDLAREKNIKLPDEDSYVVILDPQSTHLNSVKISVYQSLIRLLKRMDARFKINGIVGSKSKFDKETFNNDPIKFKKTSNYSKLKAELKKSYSDLKILVKILKNHPDDKLLRFVKKGFYKKEINQGLHKEAFNKLKTILPKVWEVFHDIERHNQFTYNGLFNVPANYKLKVGLTVKQILSLVYCSLLDHRKRFSSEKPFEIKALLNLFDAIFDSRRGYNIDSGDYDLTTPDRNRCFDGTAHSLVNCLNGIHKLVEIREVSNQVIIHKIQAMVWQLIEEKKDLFDENFILFELFEWMYKGYLSQNFKTILMENFESHITSEISKEFGKYNFDLPTLFDFALNSLKFNDKVAKKLGVKELQDLPDEKLYLLLMSDSKPDFVLSKKGYLTPLQFLLLEHTEKVKSMHTNKSLGGIDCLLDEQFFKISDLEKDDEITLKLLEVAAAKKECEQIPLKILYHALNNYILTLISKVKYWFPNLNVNVPLMGNDPILIEAALSDLDGFIDELYKNFPSLDPNIKTEKFNRTPLEIILENKNYELAKNFILTFSKKIQFRTDTPFTVHKQLAKNPTQWLLQNGATTDEVIKFNKERGILSKDRLVRLALNHINIELWDENLSKLYSLEYIRNICSSGSSASNNHHPKVINEKSETYDSQNNTKNLPLQLIS